MNNLWITLNGKSIKGRLNGYEAGSNGFVEYADGTREHGNVVVRTDETRVITALHVQVAEEVLSKEGH